jgi:phosphoadenosine phosphosulfate reductase
MAKQKRVILMDHPLRVVRELRQITDSVLVGVSTGKDSIACLDLICSHDPPFRRVQPYFMYTVPGLEFQERYLAYLERRYKVSILRIPHCSLSYILRDACYRPLTTATQSLPDVSFKDMLRHLRLQSGIQWVAEGHKAYDGLERQLMIKRCRGLDLKRRHAYPMGFWTQASVYTYLRNRRLPLPPDYAMMGMSFGWLDLESLAPIRRRFPADYERIKEYYPYVEAVFAHERFKQASAVRDTDGAPIADSGGPVQPADD